MRFIHTADLHLDAPVGTLPQRAAVRRGALEALAQMITYAKANEIKYMVIAGDLFDTPTPSPALCGAVEKIFDGAKEILFLICAGNHDAISAGGDWCHMTLPSNVKLFSREIEQVCTPEGSFVGAGFYEGMMRHPLGRLPEKSGITVGVFHGSLGDTEPAPLRQPRSGSPDWTIWHWGISTSQATLSKWATRWWQPAAVLPPTVLTNRENAVFSM